MAGQAMTRAEVAAFAAELREALGPGVRKLREVPAFVEALKLTAAEDADLAPLVAPAQRMAGLVADAARWVGPVGAAAAELAREAMLS